jgi:single-strand DNA-binding protein
MSETAVTVVGNVATAVEFRDSATGGMAWFRIAVPVRRWDRNKAEWRDGPTSFYTVWAWRALASNVAASVSVGEPLVVHGRLRVREEERDGGRRTFVDIEATSIGHDLARGTSAFRRVVRAAAVPVQPGEAAASALRSWSSPPWPPVDASAAGSAAGAQSPAEAVPTPPAPGRREPVAAGPPAPAS